MRFQFNDGGRAVAGYKGSTGDCVIRAIAIATEQPYQQVYDKLAEMNSLYAENRRDRVAKRLKKKGGTPRSGNFKKVYRPYLLSLGWRWTPTMFIGKGCQVHLQEEELPSGRIIVNVSKHLIAIIDGVINDTFEDQRNGTRCVYGYYSK